MDLPDPYNLFFSIVFGMIGASYAMYGKKENFYFLLAGLLLMSYTFIFSTTVEVIWIGLTLTIAPFLLTKFL